LHRHIGTSVASKTYTAKQKTILVQISAEGDDSAKVPFTMNRQSSVRLICSQPSGDK
jgi:hypothetical protein